METNEFTELAVGGVVAVFVFGISAMWPAEAEGCSPPPRYEAESFEGDHPECLKFKRRKNQQILFEAVNFCDSQVRLEVLECWRKECGSDCNTVCNAEPLAASDGGQTKVLARDLDVDGASVPEGETITVRLGWSTATNEGITDIVIYHREVSGGCDIGGGCGCGRQGGARATFPPLVCLPFFAFAVHRRSR